VIVEVISGQVGKNSRVKAQAVELVGIGKPVSEVARDLKISEGVLYEWVRMSSPAAQLGSEGRRAGGEEAEADELRRLRRENY